MLDITRDDRVSGTSVGHPMLLGEKELFFGYKLLFIHETILPVITRGFFQEGETIIGARNRSNLFFA